MFPELSIVLHSILYYMYPDRNYGNIIAGAVIVILIGVIAKKIMKRFDGFLSDYTLYRPKGAFGCNAGCKQCNNGEVGMPSIHSMVAGYYATKFKSDLFFVFALSRLSKAENSLFYHSISGCHSLPQVIVGYAFGRYIGTLI